MKKSLVGLLVLGSFFTGCIGDSDDDKAITVRESGDKNLYEDVLIKDGYFTDSRDKNKYKVVKIGSQYWFAENLRYVDSSKTTNLKKNVRCLDDKSSNCEKYGPLYTWTAAMDIKDSFATKSVGGMYLWQYQGICPNGWKIPSVSEWDELLSFIDRINSDEATGTSLKSVSTWDKHDSIPGGKNRFGFNMLAGGRLNNEGGFLSGGKYAYAWAADEYDAGTAKGFSFHYDKDVVHVGEYYKDHGLSVRCVATSQASVTVKGDLDSSYIAEIPFDNGTLEVDGESYKTIKIGEQTWMAENMNLKTDNSWCYKNEESSCKKYGRLYDWDDAQSVCPEGWKLPSKNDLTLLYSYHKDSRFIRSTEEWKNEDGLNFWGFDLLPAGGYKDGDFFDEKVSAYLWSSENIGSEAYALFVNYYGEPAIRSYSKSTGHSVRCIKE